MLFLEEVMKIIFFILFTIIFSITTVLTARDLVPADTSLSKTYVIDQKAGLIDQNIQELIFFHTSDLHGYGFPREILYRGVDDHSGGLFSLATLVSKKRRKLKRRRWAFNNNSIERIERRNEDDGIFLVDCGDSVSGTYNDSLRPGKDITLLMNSKLLDYDVKTIGNHSDDYGAKPFFQNIKLANFPVVIANAVEKESGKQLKNTRPYIIREESGIKVGFIGLSHAWSTRIDGVKMLDELESLEKYLPELRKKVDIVVCLSHIGLEREAKLVKKIADMDDKNPLMNVDVFMDGHSHANIHFMIDKNTVVVQAGKYGLNCGEVNIRFNIKTRKIASVKIQKHSLKTSDVLPSKKLKNEFRNLIKKVEKENQGVVEKDLNDFFMKYSIRTSPRICNPAAEFCARSLMEIPLEAPLEPDCAMVYQKSVRNHVASNDNGVVTNGILHRIVPFEEKILLVKIKGDKLFKLMEKGVFKKYSWAGLQAHIVENIENEKLVERKLLKLKIYDKSKKRFVPVEKNKTYVLACNEFFNMVYVKSKPEYIVISNLTDKLVLRRFIKKYKVYRDKYFTARDFLSKSIVYHNE